MEFGWSEEQQRLRAGLRAFLKEHLPANWDEIRAHGVAGSAQIDYSRIFCPQLAQHGYLIRHWPREMGGEAAGPWEHFILGEEMLVAGEPRGPQYMNVNWLGPTLMKFGTAAQQAQFMPQIAAGNIIWCQGYSEPGAGSDLAALKTRAVREGDHYVINGSKIWTSYSRKADYCFLLARTGLERKEISIFLLPMATPGVRVHPIPGLTEEGHLNEIFLTDVKVPATARVGEEGRAWDIIAYALAYERVGIARYELGRHVLDVAVELLKREGRFADSLVRAAAGRALCKLEAARMLTYLVVDQRAKHSPPTTDANIARVAGAQASLALLDFLAEYVPDCLLEGDKDLELYYRGNIASTIAAGTYEIQLNLVAQNALTLPRSK